MPRKGWKKPVAVEVTASLRCRQCDKYTPTAVLRGFVRQLRQLKDDMARGFAPAVDADDQRRMAQLRLMHARAVVDLLLDDADSIVCWGHEPEKRGPRKPKNEPAAEYVDPTAPLPAAERKKPRNALTVV